MNKKQRAIRRKRLLAMQKGNRKAKPPQSPSVIRPRPPPPPIDLPPEAVYIEEVPPEYVDTATGKKTSAPTPCCGCRTCDARFPLEMDEETAHVYREAKYCGFSYTFISSWCLMLFVGTIASSGIVAIGFLKAEFIKYQVVGIILVVIFGFSLPVFIVFWVCLRRQEAEIRRHYRASKNRQQVYEEQKGITDDKDKDKAKDDDADEKSVSNKNPDDVNDQGSTDDVRLIMDDNY